MCVRVCLGERKRECVCLCVCVCVCVRYACTHVCVCMRAHARMLTPSPHQCLTLRQPLPPQEMIVAHTLCTHKSDSPYGPSATRFLHAPSVPPCARLPAQGQQLDYVRDLCPPLICLELAAYIYITLSQVLEKKTVGKQEGRRFGSASAFLVSLQCCGVCCTLPL